MRARLGPSRVCPGKRTGRPRPAPPGPANDFRRQGQGVGRLPLFFEAPSGRGAFFGWRTTVVGPGFVRRGRARRQGSWREHRRADGVSAAGSAGGPLLVKSTMPASVGPRRRPPRSRGKTRGARGQGRRSAMPERGGRRLLRSGIDARATGSFGSPRVRGNVAEGTWAGRFLFEEVRRHRRMGRGGSTVVARLSMKSLVSCADFRNPPGSSGRREDVRSRRLERLRRLRPTVRGPR